MHLLAVELLLSVVAAATWLVVVFLTLFAASVISKLVVLVVMVVVTALCWYFVPTSLCFLPAHSRHHITFIVIVNYVPPGRDGHDLPFMSLSCVTKWHLLGKTLPALYQIPHFRFTSHGLILQATATDPRLLPSLA